MKRSVPRTHRNIAAPFLEPGMENLAKHLEYVIEIPPIGTRRTHISATSSSSLLSLLTESSSDFEELSSPSLLSKSSISFPCSSSEVSSSVGSCSSSEVFSSDLSLPLANASFFLKFLPLADSLRSLVRAFTVKLKTGQFSLRARAANSSSASNKHRMIGTPQSLIASTNTSFIILGKIGYEPQGLIRLIN
ncbi:hypothetical protein GQX74_002477 [Glossina fuscipes]|nr:hypothetical protein GQX74_002477 [Glossina fuscipes]